MINLFKSNRGDTIVEVMICIAILTIVLAGSFTAISRSYTSLQDSNEHAQALKIAETQVEDLRSYTGANAPNCFAYKANTLSNGNNSSITTATNSGVPPNNPCIFQADGTQAPAGSEAQFNVLITSAQNVSQPHSAYTYTVNVTWTDLSGNKDIASLIYRTQ